MEPVFAARAPFLTRTYGEFTLAVTSPQRTGGEHLVLVKGEVSGRENVLCRVASACVTSTAFDAADCDCAGQLRSALDFVARDGTGVVIYLDQEGRGHGLATKIRALRGKAEGLDTFQAVERLGLPADARDYSDVPLILSELSISSIRLLTNNPDKRSALESLGVALCGVLPCRALDPPAAARRHLLAKRQRGHTL